ncbi:hypothetical protein PMAYCL1PPCAC_08647 [Pristionchus mayeri]|uniref:Uncharacterized protein n=1 Tax=Pristionchus mayeri TaxID=1317129 RepID=A0AAN4ZC52_9BILA|nr:hypothetical protein PMAYCL1PPCAC_08647 [Pristionchus mayeri]
MISLTAVVFCPSRSVRRLALFRLICRFWNRVLMFVSSACLVHHLIDELLQLSLLLLTLIQCFGEFFIPFLEFLVLLEHFHCRNLHLFVHILQSLQLTSKIGYLFLKVFSICPHLLIFSLGIPQFLCLCCTRLPQFDQCSVNLGIPVLCVLTLWELPDDICSVSHIVLTCAVFSFYEVHGILG